MAGSRAPAPQSIVRAARQEAEHLRFRAASLRNTDNQVYEKSISAVCHLDWPKDRLLIQILDYSDEEGIQKLIKNELLKWNQKGVNILYRHRFIRIGYKAGNLKAAMPCDYVKDYALSHVRL